MLLWGEGRKELPYELPIGIEFCLAVREYEDSGIKVGFPSDSPIGVGSDNLCRSAGSDGNLKCSQSLLPPLVGPNGIYSG